MMVGSVCSGMPILRRLRKTAAMRGRSSARPVSSSTSEASVTTWRSVRPLAATRGSSGPTRSQKRATMRPTRAAAVTRPGGTS